MYIKSIQLDKKDYFLVDEGHIFSDENIYTIIIGKNGAGKSKLLRKISQCLTDVYNNKIKHNNIPSNFKREIQVVSNNRDYNIYSKPNSKKIKIIGNNNSAVSKKNLCDKCICVSTSPFDKFPLFETKGYHVDNFYNYIGLKNNNGSYSKDTMLRFLATAIVSLGVNENIKSVFHMLGYKENIKLKFSRELSDNIIRERNNIERLILHSDSAFNEILSIQDLSLRNEIIKGLVYESTFKVNSPIKYSSNYIQTLESLKDIPQYFQYGVNEIEGNRIKGLLDSGTIKIENVTLERIDGSGSLDLAEASSGEQCMMLTLLCISAVICDNSIICIDEPELSLHPEWQNEFMPLLIKLFSKYKKCHFIIATHSPQIISKLKSENSYILSADKNSVVPSINFNNRSSDYQLAQLFNAPGFKNEFLINECLDVLSILSSQEPLSNIDNKRVSNLINIKSKINEIDPVYTLISTIEKVMQVINND